MTPDEAIAYAAELSEGDIDDSPREGYLSEVARTLLAELTAARARVAAQQPVIDTAAQFVDSPADPTGRQEDALLDAVTAYRAALSAPVEATNIVGGVHSDPGDTELDDAIEQIVGDYVPDSLVRVDLAKRVLREVVRRTGLDVYARPVEAGTPRCSCVIPGSGVDFGAVDPACPLHRAEADTPAEPAGHSFQFDAQTSLAWCTCGKRWDAHERSQARDYWDAHLREAGAPAEPTGDTERGTDRG